jgi:hypothetical protein
MKNHRQHDQKSSENLVNNNQKTMVKHLQKTWSQIINQNGQQSSIIAITGQYPNEHTYKHSNVLVTY